MLEEEDGSPPKLHYHESAARPRSTGIEPRMGCSRRSAPRSRDGTAIRAMARVAVVLALFGATLLAACAPRYQHVVEQPLRSTGGLECPGYLVWNREPVS